MKKLNWVLTIFFAIFLYSCTETSTPPTTSANYLPNNVGTYWIYNMFTLDSTNTRVNATNPNLDSVIITGTETKLSYSASVFANNQNMNNTGYVPGNKWYFYKNGENINVFSGIFNEMLGLDKLPVKLPFTIDDKWMLLFDASNNTWNLHTKQITNDTVDYAGLKIPFSGNFKIDATKMNNEKITVGTSSLDCKKVKYVFSINGTAKYSLGGFPVDIPVTLSGNCYFFFADNVGIVKIYLESQTLNVQGLLSQSFPGSEQVLLRYNIK